MRAPSLRIVRPIALVLSIAALSQGATTAQDKAPDATPWIQEQLPDLRTLYEHLHRNPEISFREVETSARMARELTEAGFEVTDHIGGLGVVGVLRNGEGPTLLFRADMDALPLGERTGLPYQSKIRTESPDGRVAGVMHACGHDVHMTNFVGTARYLSSHRDSWRGTLVFMAQPAEERSGGAQQMIDDGLFERFPRPDFALAMHVTHELPTGHVALRPGPAMANVESVDVTFHGRGGHGAAPHTTIDPLVIAARYVLDIQTIISRELTPTDPAVVTVGRIDGGTKHNIIDETCRLQITIRSFDLEVHEHIKEALVRKAEAQAMSAGAPEPELSFSEFTPVLYNDPDLHDEVRAAFVGSLGGSQVHTAEMVMTAEDFGRLGRAGVPSVMFRVGTIGTERWERLQSAGEQPAPLHSPLYYPEPNGSLTTALRATIAAVQHLLPPGR